MSLFPSREEGHVSDQHLLQDGLGLQLYITVSATPSSQQFTDCHASTQCRWEMPILLRTTPQLPLLCLLLFLLDPRLDLGYLMSGWLILFLLSLLCRKWEWSSWWWLWQGAYVKMFQTLAVHQLAILLLSAGVGGVSHKCCVARDWNLVSLPPHASCFYCWGPNTLGNLSELHLQPPFCFSHVRFECVFGGIAAQSTTPYFLQRTIESLISLLCLWRHLSLWS